MEIQFNLDKILLKLWYPLVVMWVVDYIFKTNILGDNIISASIAVVIFNLLYIAIVNLGQDLIGFFTVASCSAKDEYEVFMAQMAENEKESREGE